MRARSIFPDRQSIAALVVLASGISPAAGEKARHDYRLTIENTNPGQNFSAPVIVLHGRGYGLFELGEPPGLELSRLAEDGSTAEFEALRDPEVDRVLVGRPVHRRHAPVFTTTLTAPAGRLISVAAMLTLTNDGFVAARAVPLPGVAGEKITVPLPAYDAGSEANTESCAHVPCEVHGRRMTDGAEGVVSLHPGIRGDADIAPGRGWDGPDLGRLTITRLPQENAS